ncbi:MAG: putative sulfate exporter family transporter [Desulfuromonadaceae bacterium]|nr:putative sulfate exporter family transporter [Desulfuromonadaceae bacterium]MDD5105725.1 putative sulfate exporter family transporter [Desulfuromonadaceae bacterium]
MNSIQRPLFFLLILGSATPWCGPATALCAGILFSLLAGTPWPGQTSVWSKKLLQLSVVGLGFGLSITDVWQAGREAVLYTPISIILTVVAGLLLGRLLHTQTRTSALISFGTAICGGSAIAAMAPAINADDEEIAVSLATVFSLNAAALLLFPPLGHYFALTERQFGLWSALAIHDTSSVVGAASAFGASALAVGTTVKLARAVWIAPAVLIAARFTRTRTKLPIPLFIIGFVAAASLRSLAPSFHNMWQTAAAISRQGLVVTLFLVGNGLTREVIGRVGMRPLVQGVILWIIVSTTMLAVILEGIIR